MTLLLVFAPGAAALAALFVAGGISRWRHRRDEDVGLGVLHPWKYIAPSPRLRKGREV